MILAENTTNQTYNLKAIFTINNGKYQIIICSWGKRHVDILKDNTFFYSARDGYASWGHSHQKYDKAKKRRTVIENYIFDASEKEGFEWGGEEMEDDRYWFHSTDDIYIEGENDPYKTDKTGTTYAKAQAFLDRMDSSVAVLDKRNSLYTYK